MTDFATEPAAQPPASLPTEAQATEVQEEAARAAGPPAVEGYRLEERVGVGSFGEVWAAVQVRTGQRCAVKVLSQLPGLDWRYFRQEVERLQEVAEHPHVVTLLDADLEGQPPYYVMPLLRHGSLAQLAARPSVEQVAVWLKEIAGALQFTHDKGLLHCDLKPSNVLLDEQGRTRLVDFGQARLREAASGVLGTLGFMAPEQAEPKAVPSVRWDIYSLGATAYFLLTGELPRLSQDDMTSLRSEARGSSDRIALYRGLLAAAPLVPIRKLNPAVDPELAFIVERCLENQPERRTGNAAEIIVDLERRERHEPLLCRRPWTRGYRLRTWIRRPSSMLITALGVCLAALLVVIGWQMAEHARTLQQANDDLIRKMVALRQSSRGLRDRILRGMLLQADTLEGQNDLHGALLWRAHALSHNDDPTLPLGLKANNTRLVGVDRIEGATGLVAGGRRYVLVLGEKPRLYDVEKGTHVDLPGEADSAVFSADLHTVTLRRGDTSDAYSLPDATPAGGPAPQPGYPWVAGIRLPAGKGGVVGNPDRVLVSHDGSLVLALYPHEARLFSPRSLTGELLPYAIKDAAFSPNGEFIALAGRDARGHQAWVYEPGHPHPVYSFYHESPLTGVAFSPDGAKLLTASQDGCIRRFNLRSGRQVHGIFHHGAPLKAVATTGYDMFGLAEDGTLRHWKALHPPALKLPGPVSCVAFTPTQLVVAGANYVSLGGRTQPTDFPVTQLAVSAERVAAVGEKGEYVVWRDGQRELASRSGFARVSLATDGTLALLNANGLRLFPPEGEARTVHQQPKVVAFPLAQSADDGQRVADVYNGNLTLWEGGTPQSVASRPAQLAFSADGKWLGQLGPGANATVWNLTMGRLADDAALPLAAASGRADAQLEFSPNGQYLAARCWEGVQLWRNPWNEKPMVLRTQTRDVAGAFAFSPDSTRLAWGGADGSFQVWDLKTGRHLLPWCPFSWTATCVAFSPDGQWLALGCEDGRVQLLDLSAAQVPMELDTGCRLNEETGVLDTLSPEEWQQLSAQPAPPHNLFEGRELPDWARGFR